MTTRNSEFVSGFSLRDMCEEARDRHFANGGFPRNFKFEEIPADEPSDDGNCEFIDHQFEFVEDDDKPRKRRFGNCTVIDHDWEFVS